MHCVAMQVALCSAIFASSLSPTLVPRDLVAMMDGLVPRDDTSLPVTECCHLVGKHSPMDAAIWRP